MSQLFQLESCSTKSGDEAPHSKKVMLFRQKALEGIRSGSITLAFRKWKKPSARAGGTLLTPIGQLSIDAVDVVEPLKITNSEAKRAGFASREDLLQELDSMGSGDVYRIKLGSLRADPRVSLRERVPTDKAETTELQRRLARLDAYSSTGPWTMKVLKLIASKPGVRAGDLCLVMKQEKFAFKLNVRKLKKLGLTESLAVGYKLSPRGNAVLRAASK